ncbi:MAG: hypothetical protein ACI9BD_000886, partial [Candidatus Marinamargulisbacteria bacterium]
MLIPEISTFVQNQDQAIRLIQAGATHLIIEDSKLSVRSFSNDFDSENFSKVEQIASAVRTFSPDTKLSFNCDLMFHHRHEKTL